jgi:serine/threonine protein kinase
MRMNLADYSLPLFREETIVLGILADVPGVVGFCEAGFIRLGKDMALPDDRHHASGRALAGQAVRFAPDQARTFLDDMDQRVADGWLPYLALPLHDQKDSLMALCDSGYTSGKFFPIKDSLRIAIQICDILQTAHIRNIVYRDHKILHYYWRHEDNGVYIIDWNVAKYIPEGPSESERQFDLVQFGARALHHILTGRVAPGALPLGPNRPEEIEQASRSYQAQWTYDDRRLPRGVRAIIEQVLCGGYILPEVLREDLRQSYDHLPDE